MDILHLNEEKCSTEHKWKQDLKITDGQSWTDFFTDPFRSPSSKWKQGTSGGYKIELGKVTSWISPRAVPQASVQLVYTTEGCEPYEQLKHMCPEIFTSYGFHVTHKAKQVDIPL